MLELNKDNFDKEVLQCKKPVVVDFWATWCMPCRMLTPIFEEASKELPEVKFGKLLTEENEELTEEYEITGIPALIIFKEGKIAGRITGLLPKEKLKERILSFL
jgi:thioredoxin 1